MMRPVSEQVVPGMGLVCSRQNGARACWHNRSQTLGEMHLFFDLLDRVCNPSNENRPEDLDPHFHLHWRGKPSCSRHWWGATCLTKFKPINCWAVCVAKSLGFFVAHVTPTTARRECADGVLCRRRLQMLACSCCCKLQNCLENGREKSWLYNWT